MWGIGILRFGTRNGNEREEPVAKSLIDGDEGTLWLCPGRSVETRLYPLF
jgi:hypothetical protein